MENQYKQLGLEIAELRNGSPAPYTPFPPEYNETMRDIWKLGYQKAINDALAVIIRRL